MSCAGHPFFKTPNLDRIAAEGARFANVFVTTSLCSPSRASILSGRFARSHGVRNHLTDDPQEMHNLIDDPKWARQRRVLERELQRLSRQAGPDKMPVYEGIINVLREY